MAVLALEMPIKSCIRSRKNDIHVVIQFFCFSDNIKSYFSRRIMNILN